MLCLRKFYYSKLFPGWKVFTEARIDRLKPVRGLLFGTFFDYKYWLDKLVSQL